MRVLRELADELRAARLAAGMTQRSVAQVAGTSRSQVGRIERAELRSLSLVLAARVASAVGLDLSVRAYPSGPRLRDAGHLELIGRVRSTFASSWRLRLEAPLPIESDQRAWDLLARLGPLRVGVDVENRLTDIQAFLRREELKKRDGGVDRLIIVVRATHLNRAAVRSAAAALAATLPVSSRRALAAIRAGRDPGGDALLLL